MLDQQLISSTNRSRLPKRAIRTDGDIYRRGIFRLLREREKRFAESGLVRVLSFVRRFRLLAARPPVGVFEPDFAARVRLAARAYALHPSWAFRRNDALGARARPLLELVPGRHSIRPHDFALRTLFGRARA